VEATRPDGRERRWWGGRTVTVPLMHRGHREGRRTLTLTADNDGEPKHDRDRIRFQCHPHE